MSRRYTKEWQLLLICDACGRFAKQDDSTDQYTPFGCADPDNPEPYDPSHICIRCGPEYKAGWEEMFDRNPDAVHWYGDWQKSWAEQEAAKERGLVWLSGDGLGKWTTRRLDDPSPHTFRAYCWVTPAEHARLLGIKEAG